MSGKYGVSMQSIEHSNLSKKYKCNCSHCQHSYSKNNHRYCSIRQYYEPKFSKCRYFEYCKKYKYSIFDNYKEEN